MRQLSHAVLSTSLLVIAAACQGPDFEEVAQLSHALTFAESGGIVSMEAENFTANSASGSHSWAPLSAGGASGGSTMETTPDNGTAYNTGYVTSSPRLDYEVTFAQAGSYQVWVRGRAGGSAAYDSDSLHVGLNGAAVASADRISSFSTSFGWSQSTMDGPVATLNIPSPGVHTVNVWMREDGFDLDKVVLTPDVNFVPTGTGPAETPAGGGDPGDCSPTTHEAENMNATTGGSTSGGWNIWSNGNISTTHAFVPGAATLTVTASGTQAVGVWPNMVVSIGGTQVGEVTVNSASWADYAFPFVASGGPQTISVAFDNDYYDSAAGQDRNLLVDKVLVECPPSSACTDGETQPGPTSCGLNDRGSLEQLCVDGDWEDTATCLDPDVCTDEETRPTAEACGLNGRGSVVEVCVAGAWEVSGICDDPDECLDDDEQAGTTSCGLNGRGALGQRCVVGSWEDTTDCVDPDECVDDETRAGTTACGFNARGTLDEVCVAGQWEDSSTCQDPDECADGSTQLGTTVCGLNGRGALEQHCNAGSWEDTATCLDPDACLDGATRAGTTACGFNGRGTLDQLCVVGQWQDTAACQDPDECTDGSTQQGTGSCGLNGRGTLLQVCSAGSWEDSGLCDDPDECVDDSARSGTTACGLNGRGALEQTCVLGTWQDTTECADPDACMDDDTRAGTTACGLNGRGTLDEVCVVGQWQDSTTCVDPDECTDGATQPGSSACGLNGRGVLEQSCTSGTWEDSGLCLDPDECTDGETRTGTTACGLNGRGVFEQSCQIGSWEDTTCADPDECVDGSTQEGTTPCGSGGNFEQLCTAGGWEDTSICIEPDLCGDAVCGQAENCNSCSEDCGACPPPVFLEEAGQVVMEGESFDVNTSQGSSDSWSQVSDASAAGGSLMFVGPDNGNYFTSGVAANSPRLDFDVHLESTGSWTMWIRGKSTSGSGYASDSCWGGIDESPITSYFDFVENGSFQWVSKSFNVSSAGTHTINVWMREDGFSLDKIIITTNGGFTPSGQGPAQSAKGGAGTCGDETCAPDEDCSICATDCGECTVCGDDVCSGAEDCDNCSADCGICLDPPAFLGCTISSSVPSSWNSYWDQATAENGCKWGSVESARDVMNWSQCDLAYNHTRARGIPFRFHVFIWGQQEPAWLAGLSHAAQLLEIREWMSAASQRYPGAELIDVVNEPLHEIPIVHGALGGDGATGWDWVVEAFRLARQYFPDALLMPNDYGLMGDPGEIQDYLVLVEALKAADYQGVSVVDAVGVQSHYFNVEALSAQQVTESLDLLATAGLPIYITELDIRGVDNDPISQLERYQTVFPAIWEHPSVEGVTLWGYIQGSTWRPDLGIMEANGTERPALSWLMDYTGRR